MKHSFHSLCARDISLATDIISQISTTAMCKDEFQNMFSNFTMMQGLTSPRSYFLLGQVSVYARKIELRVRDIYINADIISQISMIKMCKNEFRTGCSNVTTIRPFKDDKLIRDKYCDGNHCENPTSLITLRRDELKLF